MIASLGASGSNPENAQSPAAAEDDEANAIKEFISDFPSSQASTRIRRNQSKTSSLKQQLHQQLHQQLQPTTDVLSYIALHSKYVSSPQDSLDSSTNATPAVPNNVVTSDSDQYQHQLHNCVSPESAGDVEKRLLSFSNEDASLGSPICVNNLDIVTLNVGGMKYQTFLETLSRFPQTLLGCPLKRSVHYNAHTNEYFFDRHRQSFEGILYYYQSRGRLKRPENVPVDIFVRELKFFEMGKETIEKFWELEGYRKPAALPLPKNPILKHIWQVMEHPDTSILARICAFISVAVILMSTLSFCLETLPHFHQEPRRVNASGSGESTEWSGNSTAAPRSQNASEEDTFVNPNEASDEVFFIIELVCITWFTLELSLRFISCPSKKIFLKSFLNWVDFIAIVPFFINLAFTDGSNANTTMSFAVLRVLRLVRVFRIFKLSRHSRGLQVLGMTFRASVQELCLLIFFMLIGLVLFSSAVYFAETGIIESQFSSIPAAFWYTIVTMTTVGYGDMTPVGPLGKLVGSLCAIVGVLVLALPVPVIVANFKHFYRQETRLAHMRALEGEDSDVEDEDGVSLMSSKN